MYVIAGAAENGWDVLRCTESGAVLDARTVPGLVAAVTGIERAEHPRWVFGGEEYASLLEAGVRVRRCHDLALVESILLSFEGRYGEPATLAAAYARLAGLPVPEEQARTRRPSAQPVLFETEPDPLPGGVSPARACAEVLADQLRRIEGSAWAPRLRMLVAAESAGALAAAEMQANGLPYRADVHAELLTGLFGPRPANGARPKVLADLATEVSEAFGGKPVNPEHPGSVQRAFARAGIDLPSTKAAVLREIEHPAVAPLLRYKELSRLYAAHGWFWLDEWVREGRFCPEFVVGGVVSGRWASRGGAALQLPKLLRTCVRADPGRRLVVADAAQLEPRVLAALSEDSRLAELATAGDMYESLAEDAFAGQRHDAKIAMLSAMYGGTAGHAAALLAVLRKRFPEAIGYVERAARHGEHGRSVRSVLGRTSPPPAALMGEAGLDSLRAARDWGRFTRNFVVQSSASDWALTVLATLRLDLLDELPDAELVFFVHDEIIVHCRARDAPRCAELVERAAEQARRLVFGRTKVRFPLPANVVDCYADAK
nr:bifunctional 3'-5' exonuclease/DNA polymerase [Sciscionella marina]